MSEQILIYPHVDWDPASSQIDPFVILGRPPRNRQPGELPLSLGPGATLRSGTVIYAGTRIGAGLQTGHGAMIREDNELGDQVSVGTHAVLEYGNRIGHRVRIHSNCFLERVILEDDVFLGPQVVFTDDLHPICPRYQECRPPARIGRYTRIGANTTLLPGVQIGENCLIGAGSVVTTHIPAHHVAAGNPARIVRRIEELSCEAGFFSRPYVWLENEP